MIRRRKNKILALRETEGNWLGDEEGLKLFTNQFYKDLFTEKVAHRDLSLSRSSYPMINQDALNYLDRVFFQGGDL